MNLMVQYHNPHTCWSCGFVKMPKGQGRHFLALRQRCEWVHNDRIYDSSPRLFTKIRAFTQRDDTRWSIAISCLCLGRWRFVTLSCRASGNCRLAVLARLVWNRRVPSGDDIKHDNDSRLQSVGQSTSAVLNRASRRLMRTLRRRWWMVMWRSRPSWRDWWRGWGRRRWRIGIWNGCRIVENLALTNWS